MLGLIVFIITATIIATWVDDGNWKPDNRNPYRRYCSCCGIQQDFYEPGGWQYRYLKNPPSCKYNHDD